MVYMFGGNVLVWVRRLGFRTLQLTPSQAMNPHNDKNCDFVNFPESGDVWIDVNLDSLLKY